MRDLTGLFQAFLAKKNYWNDQPVNQYQKATVKQRGRTKASQGLKKEVGGAEVKYCNTKH